MVVKMKIVNDNEAVTLLMMMMMMMITQNSFKVCLPFISTIEYNRDFSAT